MVSFYSKRKKSFFFNGLFSVEVQGHQTTWGFLHFRIILQTGLTLVIFMFKTDTIKLFHFQISLFVFMILVSGENVNL